MPNSAEFISSVHHRLTRVAIGASALRNQGAPGIVGKSREYLDSIRLSVFFEKLPDEKEYRKYLNRHTLVLQGRYPKAGRSWGAARKALNLFFRELVYNKIIADHFGLSKNIAAYETAIRHLEVPLDRSVATEIYANTETFLTRWGGIKGLDLSISSEYQCAAAVIARKKKISRVHLDLEYW